jgi:hypothetical protein
MSEYQYYEFQAIDRPLSERERRELRACSTRATITSTRFVNHYEWGDLKGDPRAWMEKYFDAFLYLAERICNAAEPGSIFASTAVLDLSLGKGATASLPTRLGVGTSKAGV